MQLSQTGQRLAQHLAQAAQRSPKQSTETVHINDVAGGIYFAYEQLRNAADYNHHHLVLRSAIERFLRRTLYLPDPNTTDIGLDLLTELTQSRYLHNDSVPRTTIVEIDTLVAQYAQFFTELTTVHGVARARASQWVHQVLSVLIERMIVPQTHTEGFIDVAHYHYLTTIDQQPFRQVPPAEFEVALYCAVHEALLHSDIATVRTLWLLNHSTASFTQQCDLIDTYFGSPITHKLARLINKYGAPMRALHELFVRQGASQTLLHNHDHLMSKMSGVIAERYETIRRHAAANLWRMLIFVLITKTLVGLAVEIPYDLLVAGTVAAIPLAINLVFPLAYMMSASFGLSSPNASNTRSILNYIERILYDTGTPPAYRLSRSRLNPRLRAGFNVIYAITFLVPLALTVWALAALGFNLLQGAIFFIFFSGVSFFRFRLLQASREMDIIARPRTIAAVISDFLYLPFVSLGRWLSDRYQRLNIITFLLDVVIELPLKTSLQVLRQWTNFISDKREEL